MFFVVVFLTAYYIGYYMSCGDGYGVGFGSKPYIVKRILSYVLPTRFYRGLLRRLSHRTKPYQILIYFFVAYYIGYYAPWINQVGKGSSHALADQFDDFSPPG